MKITGYTYKADNYCPLCAVAVFLHTDFPSEYPDAERVFSDYANAKNIDREDEASFDSGDFPKVIFSDTRFECGKCGPMDVYAMTQEQFEAALETRTSPENVLANAPRIYTYLGDLFEESCEDSVLREWAFGWWSEQTGQDYEVIYQKWLTGAGA